MSFFISVGIIFLAMLIQSLMQLMPGIFAIFYHSVLGKTTRKKADDMSLSFILGVEIFAAVFFVVSYTIISVCATQHPFYEDIFPWIAIAIFFSETVASFLFYYRKSKTSELFISRTAAKNLTTRASNVKNRSDTIALGLLSNVCELPFTLPLFFIVSSRALKTFSSISFVSIFLYILAAILPIIIIRIFYHTGHNLAFIERFRTKNKTFFKFAISLSYLMIALLLIMEVTL